VPNEPRYAIGDLADLGGVSRRTVRYYVQEGLLPTPFGIGRGNHYGPEHLDQLLRVRSLQEAGHTLDEIRRALNGEDRVHVQALRAAPFSEQGLPAREVWRRLTLAPGVELHVAGGVGLPSPGKLAELVSWCRQNFPGGDSGHVESDHSSDPGLAPVRPPSDPD
jgi:DNA-binding transcriptional MerR regulator